MGHKIRQTWDASSKTRVIYMYISIPLSSNDISELKHINYYFSIQMKKIKRSYTHALTYKIKQLVTFDDINRREKES